jgi:Putative transposase
MAERKAELLQVPYFHVVFTLPAEIGAIAYQNKASIYALLFKAASDTMLTIAADPKHLGAKIGITAVLHTWGSAMTHHPHVHMIVTGGGISPDRSRWIASRPDYLVPVEVLSALFRGRMLGMLIDAHAAGQLQFFSDYQHLADRRAFKTYLAPLWETDWFVYAKRPFAGPEQVLAYLSRYTHRVAISNSRLISADASGVTFTYKDYRIEGSDRYKTMTLEPGEFIRRFLMHVLPKGFHRIRHYGLLANGGDTRAEKLARARQLIDPTPQLAPTPQPPDGGTYEDTTLSQEPDHPCPRCGSCMVIIDTFQPGSHPRHRPSTPVSILPLNINTS